MANKDNQSVLKEAQLTPIADTKGYEVFICDPPWFDSRKKYKIVNAPPRTAALEFDGEDLNYMARVLYAEASGSFQLKNKKERDLEKSAIINVNHFRLNRKGYPSDDYVAEKFRAVCDAPKQFESVFTDTPKFSLSQQSRVASLRQRECLDLSEALEAIKLFLTNGPDGKFQFDNFRGYDPHGRGEHIGRSRFWLSKTGASLLDKNP
jgi:hypothetical protein